MCVVNDTRPSIFIAIDRDVISQRQLCTVRLQPAFITGPVDVGPAAVSATIRHPFITDSLVRTSAISRQELMRLFRRFERCILRLYVATLDGSQQESSAAHQRINAKIIAHAVKLAAGSNERCSSLSLIREVAGGLWGLASQTLHHR